LELAEPVLQQNEIWDAEGTTALAASIAACCHALRRRTAEADYWLGWTREADPGWFYGRLARSLAGAARRLLDGDDDASAAGAQHDPREELVQVLRTAQDELRSASRGPLAEAGSPARHGDAPHPEARSLPAPGDGAGPGRPARMQASWTPFGQAAVHGFGIRSRSAQLYPVVHGGTPTGHIMRSAGVPGRTIFMRAPEARQAVKAAATPVAAHDAGSALPALERSRLTTLTNREREAVRHVARGLSNREIAESSGLSVRTVEGHLYQAYAKLQVRGRRELLAQLRGIPA
jgi:DNA-binding CsgD family transcriptional regulator